MFTRDTVKKLGWGGGGRERGALALNANKIERQRKRKSRGEGNDEQRKRLDFQKGFLLQKGPSHSPLTSTTDSFRLKPDRCAGGRRQESSLCVVLVCFCGFRDVKTESRAFFFLLLFFVFVVMATGFVFSVAVGRMHCACRDERWGEGGGNGYGRRKQERGSVRCSEVGTELKNEESAATRPLGGRSDMFFLLWSLSQWLT